MLAAIPVVAKKLDLTTPVVHKDIVDPLSVGAVLLSVHTMEIMWVIGITGNVVECEVERGWAHDVPRVFIDKSAIGPDKDWMIIGNTYGPLPEGWQ